MEQKQSSSSQGRQQRPASRRRRRRRRRSSASRPGPPPAPAANRAPAERGDARPAAAEAPAHAPPPATDSPVCPLCAKPVGDLYTAIAYGERGAPAHFDCIMALLGEREELEEGARLCYLGGGSFGVVQVRPSARPGDRGGTLLIRKRIEVEEKDAAPAWREQLRVPLPEQRVAVAASEAAPCR